MRNKIRSIGYTLCTLCISGFLGAFTDCICITFFGEPEFPEENSPSK